MKPVAKVTVIGAPPALPLVVQLGFSGSRRLFDDEGADVRLAGELRDGLVGLLQELRQRLGLTSQHFCIGISQLAVGGDMRFTEALMELDWRQRLFLPQPRKEFLEACSQDGTPDFTLDQRATALRLFDGMHIIEESVAATSASREDRFEEAAVHILVEADVMICLRRRGATERPGGTLEMGRRARIRHKPLLDIEVAMDGEGALILDAQWSGFEHFNCAALPPALQSLAPPLLIRNNKLPTLDDYIGRLKAHASRQAGQRSRFFSSAALVIIGTHVTATLLATASLKVPWSGVVFAMIAVEVVLLSLGLITHLRLHHDRVSHDWALARLTAEVARSAASFAQVPQPLRHLLAMPLPHSLRAVLRTMNVLHLCGGRQRGEVSWQSLRHDYLLSRLRDPKRGQLPYYRRQYDDAWKRMKNAGKAFTVFSGAALAAIVTKALALALDGVTWRALEVAAGVLAIWLPVLAVGVMSLAAAHDLDARANTFKEIHDFLERQESDIAAASSLPELALLMAETETRLIGETLNWFARRAYISVA